jgi:hypothetical protein
MFIHDFNRFRFHLVCPGVQTVYKLFLHGLNGCGDSIRWQWTYWWKSDSFLQLEVSLNPFLLLQNHKWPGPRHGMLNWRDPSKYGNCWCDWWLGIDALCSLRSSQSELNNHLSSSAECFLLSLSVLLIGCVPKHAWKHQFIFHFEPISRQKRGIRLWVYTLPGVVGYTIDGQKSV